MRRVPARELAALQLGVVALVAAPLALATETVSLELPARVWGSVLFLGLVCSAFAFGAQTWAQRRTPPSRTALILALEPDTDSVALRALKDHENPDTTALRVALDPRTLLLKRS